MPSPCLIRMNIVTEISTKLVTNFRSNGVSDIGYNFIFDVERIRRINENKSVTAAEVSSGYEVDQVNGHS